MPSLALTWPVRLLLWVAGGYLLLVALAWIFQRQLQYFPEPGEPPLPGDERYEGIEKVALRADDGTALRAWFWPGTRPGTLLVLHGNAGHRGHRLDWVEPLHLLGWGVFLLDYRGYGGSGGSPSEEGFYADAEAAATWLGERGHEPLVYLAESIGCGVAVELAVRRPPAALILQSGASSITAVARRAYPFLPVGWILKDRFEADRRIASVRCPVLFLHGTRDRIVPIDLGRALFEAAPDPKEWCELATAGHNDMPDAGGRAYYGRIQDFLERHVEG